MSIELAAGLVIAGRYRLDQLIGEGGMGVVWSATHVVTRKALALKLLKASTAGNDERGRRLIREARAACAVAHPNVVQVHDVIELEDGSPVLVMDLLRGESLRARMRAVGPMSVADAATLLLPVVSAVGTAHALGIVHRDLKPENIFLVTREGGRDDVRVLDFGLAKLIGLEGEESSQGLTRTGAVIGTPHYMAPEQIIAENVDHHADIWALGVIFYECLAAFRPTDAANVGKVLKRVLTGTLRPLRDALPDLPDDILDIVDRMLAQDPGARPSDLNEVRVVLERYADVTAPAFGAPREGAPPDAPPAAPLGPLLREAESGAGVHSELADTQLAPQELAARPPGRRPRLGKATVYAASALSVAAVAFGVWYELTPAPVDTPVVPPPLPPRTVRAPDEPSPNCPPGMRFIPGGTFAMGDDDGKDDERPRHTITVPGFCMDLVEVTVGAYATCVSEGRCRAPSTSVLWSGLTDDVRSFESSFCRAYQSDKEDHPMNCLSWFEAERYCRFSRKRLATEAEWEFAAAGGAEQRPYPWGIDAPAPHLLNACDPVCAAVPRPSGPMPGMMFEAPDGWSTTAPVGSYPAGDSRDGVHDLAGNVWEWTASTYCPYPIHDCESPYRVFRGGGFATYLPPMARATNRMWSSPENRYMDVGLRCAANTASVTPGVLRDQPPDGFPSGRPPGLPAASAFPPSQPSGSPPGQPGAPLNAPTSFPPSQPSGSPPGQHDGFPPPQPSGSPGQQTGFPPGQPGGF